jgi:hypothetical protein
MVAKTVMPADRRALIVCQRSSIEAQCGSKIFRTSSRFVVTEKLTRRRVRLAASRSRGMSRRGREGFEQRGHQTFGRFGWLVGVSKRRAVNHLAGAERFGQKFRGVGFESRVVAPVFPVVRAKACIHAHGGHVAVAASESAVPRGRQRVGEAGFEQIAGRRAQDGAGF